MRLYLALILLIAAVSVQGQVPFYKDISIADDDQPIAVHTIAQDANGYILAGTAAGLYQYNGQAFKRMAVAAQQPVTAITCRGAATYLACKDGSIYLLRDAMLKLLARAAENITVNSLLATGDSTVIAATTRGLITYRNGKPVSCYSTANGLSDDYVYNVYIDPSTSKMIAATDGGINIYSSGTTAIKPTVLTTRSGLSDNIVRAIAYGSDGSLIAGSQQGGLCRIALRTTAVLYCTKEWQWGQVNDVLSVGDNTWWVATDDGYLIEALAADTGFTTRSLYHSNKKLKKLYADKGGNIWCATNEGITRFSPPLVTNLPVASPYALNSVTATTGYEGKIAYALGNKLYIVSRGRLPDLIARTKNTITALHTDHRGRLWIGTIGGGVLCMQPGQKPGPLSNIAQLNNAHILSLTSAGDTLWVAGLNGVEQISIPGNLASCRLIRHHSKATGIGSDYVYMVYADKAGRIWMATDGAGVCSYHDNKYQRYSIPGFTSKVVYSISQDTKGSIWLATLHDGLFVYDNKRWTQLNERNGLTSSNISTVAAGPEGRVIIVHQKGIDEYYSDQKIFRHYNRRLGMDIDSTSPVLNCYARDSSGDLYIPYEHGFIAFTNGQDTADIRPGIHISGISLFQRPVRDKKQQFGATDNSFTFYFDGTNFTNPDRLFYRYKLQGFNNSWIPTNDLSAVYPQLPPGEYTFRVQAALSPGYDQPVEDSYSFTIASPLWRRWWFIVSVLSLASAAIVLFFRQREKKLKHIALLEKERHEYEYEYLRSQVNPHFLFNSFNTLASLIDEDTELATGYTISLSDFYRSLLLYNNRNMILLAEEWELLEKYIYIQKSRFGEALLVALVAAPGIMQTAKIVPMALQLLVENAIKHNVVSKAKPLRITVEVTSGEVCVSNNIQPKVNKEAGTGLGLANLRKRYAIHNKTLTQYIENEKFIVKLPLL
ncbi:MAG: histidine kinase [Bacteroidota bacterium]